MKMSVSYSYHFKMYWNRRKSDREKNNKNEKELKLSVMIKCEINSFVFSWGKSCLPDVLIKCKMAMSCVSYKIIASTTSVYMRCSFFFFKLILLKTVELNFSFFVYRLFISRLLSFCCHFKKKGYLFAIFYFAITYQVSFE